MREAVLRIRLLQLLARDHDRDGGLGDEVVGEGAEEDTVEQISAFPFVEKCRLGESCHLPLEGAPTART